MDELCAMKLDEATKKVENGIEEILTYYVFTSDHWIRIRTNNVMERLNREIRRRTRVVSCFSDRNSALMLVCARPRYVAGTQWGKEHEYEALRNRSGRHLQRWPTSFSPEPVNLFANNSGHYL